MLPYSVVQWRPFRKIEIADFKLDDVAPKKSDNCYDTSLVFGIPPKKGIILCHIPCDGPPDKDNSEITKSVDILIKKYGDFFEKGIPVALSFWEMGVYGPVLDRMLVRTPELTIFKGDRTNYAWQAHETFRFLERGSLVALANGAPYKYRSNQHMCYWSDGIRGRIQFLG